jgi:hypothetical protein
MKLKSALRWSEKGQNIRRCAMAKIASSFAVSMFVKASGSSGRAKIHSDDPKHALGLAQYLRTIGYDAWIEDTNGNAIDEKALKMAISSYHKDAPSS